MTPNAYLALFAVVGAVLVVAGVALAAGVAGALIAAGVFLVVAALALYDREARRH